jgi:hypothetical protein
VQFDYYWEGSKVGSYQTAGITFDNCYLYEDCRCQFRMYQQDEYRCATNAWFFKRPGDSAFNLGDTSSCETCEEAGCRNQAYTRSNACKPPATRSRSIAFTRSRLLSATKRFSMIFSIAFGHILKEDV